MTCTKQKLVDAAIFLFNTKGYNGTSVRDIAKEADVNVSNVSYYFSNKQGLLEHLVMQFLEGYMDVLERVADMQSILLPKEMLHMTVRDLVRYQSQHRQLTRFFYREVSLDSTLIREIMTTYLMREKSYFQALIHRGVQKGEFRQLSFSIFLAQLKGLLSSPYLNAQYIAEVLYEYPSEDYFMNAYMIELKRWMDQALEPAMSVLVSS